MVFSGTEGKNTHQLHGPFVKYVSSWELRHLKKMLRIQVCLRESRA